MIDLDREGSEDLVAVFSGAHLHRENVFLYRWHAGQLECVSLAAAGDGDYAVLRQDSDGWLIEIGELSPGESGGGRLYRYDRGTLLDADSTWSRPEPST
ncbi:hypothetical protein LOK74_22610 [Brevibacillus humidisoli]|uniref:hypothetical protein n=1 Tax=Brevibacillus humidisoli TaxID=2895522 RepID=UPI001E29AA8C|nr:hypothetical protein [Brevibacillus humidisoli]UFJ40750.1 hypothetical protein LOK74_22610 [Brevibacillus humidisoli]